MQRLMMVIYFTAYMITFIYLTFFDGYVYTPWNWIIAVPLNLLFAAVWPIYWGVACWFI